jgi:hypothetical protein
MKLQLNEEESRTFDRGDAVDCDLLRKELTRKAKELSKLMNEQVEVHFSDGCVWFIVENQNNESQ